MPRQTRKKGIGLLTAIVRHMRKGSADEDYVACMKERGYEVKSMSRALAWMPCGDRSAAV